MDTKPKHVKTEVYVFVVLRNAPKKALKFYIQNQCKNQINETQIRFILEQHKALIKKTDKRIETLRQNPTTITNTDLPTTENSTQKFEEEINNIKEIIKTTQNNNTHSDDIKT